MTLKDQEKFSTNTLVSFFTRLLPPLKTLHLLQVAIEHEHEVVRILQKTLVLTHLQIIPEYLTHYNPCHLFVLLAESWLVRNHTCEQILPKRSLHPRGPYSDTWNDVANAFGPISEITNPLRRPFSQLSFQLLEDVVQEDWALNDEENRMNIVALQDAGINLKFLVLVVRTTENYSLEEL
jgi:hypothetical protein